MKKTGRALISALFLSIASVAATSAITTTAAPQPSEKTDTHALIRYLLDQDLGRRTFSFSDVVSATSGKKIIAVDPENSAHQQITQAIDQAARESLNELNVPDSPIRKLRRINEASRYFEDILLKKINASDNLTCTIPTNTQGNQQRSGYPDLHITHTAADGTQTHAYLDPKLYEKKSQASSLRTFYFEPRTRTNKIQHNALHLLIGISHDGKQGQWTFLDWKLCDLSTFNVRLKAEFQASNRDLYRPDLIIPSNESKLWYQQPAKTFEEALPLGNGRLGAMIDGGIQKSHILFNEDSLWSGWAAKNDRPGAFEALKEVRELLKANKNKEADKVALEKFCSLEGYGKPSFGAYQSFCDAYVTFDHNPKSVTQYTRTLDLETAVATVTYVESGVTYTREYFSSHPDGVIVMRYTASQPGMISFDLNASTQHKNHHITTQQNQLILSGQIDTKNKQHPGMLFEARWQVAHQGGTLNTENQQITVKGADSAIIIMAGATNYRLHYPDYQGESPNSKNIKTLKAATQKSYASLLKNHTTDYQSIYKRVTLSLKSTPASDLPTDQRIKAYKKSPTDQSLTALLFQYGRYLMIASSRKGGMPANLQGLWNKSNSPPWQCDYHLNINMQMNYWPVGSTNLGECAEPMTRWAKDLSIPGALSAKVHYNSRGWVAHHSANVWGFTPPGPKRGIHMLEAESCAFLCQNIWDHYAFSQDKKYLREIAWPLLKGAAEFWIDNLQEVEGGHLAVSPSYSPEHGPLSDGAYYQTMIIWTLFTDCMEASRILNQDQAFAKKLSQLRDRLQPLKVGEFGQLQEWRNPQLEKKSKTDKHRHVSHMYALYPSRQIAPGRDQKFIDAARQSMIYRGDAATGWSMGWKINLWARFLDGDHALKLINNFISQRIYTNLWCAHPPFQIDGNFGYTAGVVEMLLQSQHQDNNHHRIVHLLPALPTAWSEGTVTGLKARGNITVDIAWKKGTLTHAQITSPTKQTIIVRLGEKTKKIELKKGTPYKLKAL